VRVFAGARWPWRAADSMSGRFHDNRGYFQEILNEERYPAFANDPKQISVSHSKKNVVRGLHRSPYFKLVTVLSGKIIDILVDLDPISPTFKTWRAVELSAEAASQVFIPPKFGHGFIALADNTIVCYAQGGAFVAANEMDVNIFDPEIGISLPELQDRKSLTMSEKDLLSPYLKEALVSWKSRHG
jgi:dTDP-4-dehydrorhamnose 3,5-epimerase